MTERAAPLTTEQKRICRANSGMFASDIAKLPGMEKQQNARYQIISELLKTIRTKHLQICSKHT